MHSITINFKNITVYKHLKWFLERFSSKEIEIIENSIEFDRAKELVVVDYVAMNTGDSDLLTANELDKEMEEIINTYES